MSNSVVMEILRNVLNYKDKHPEVAGILVYLHRRQGIEPFEFYDDFLAQKKDKLDSLVEKSFLKVEDRVYKITESGAALARAFELFLLEEPCSEPKEIRYRPDEFYERIIRE